ncbi:ankyrin repeat protein [Colletotrichum kahawae]|uniref:Ankyrin repeat protein n=1 Tax=Colletotrichum kahawae TaxID=34407 RepID=A0AAE0D133_COLKA|nr:ankyrin repeat protein [Colletotrichum kahawae]
MDPGTALAIVGLSLQILGGVKEYYNSWKTCDDDVRQFLDDLQRLEAVLGHLQTTLKQPHLDATIISTICDACHKMKDEMDEVKAMFRKFKKDGSPSTMMQKLKHMERRVFYVFRKSTIARFMEIIEKILWQKVRNGFGCCKKVLMLLTTR